MCEGHPRMRNIHILKSGCFLVVLAVQSIFYKTSALRHGFAPRWIVEKYCKGHQGIVKVPWDCSGFLLCTSTLAQPSGSWIECGESLQFDEILETCVRHAPGCQDQNGVAVRLCPTNPDLKFPHLDSCAMFYDCSRTKADRHLNLSVYENECPHPQLFDPETGSCQLTEVMCSNKPATRCGYRTECLSECKGKPNGFHEKDGAVFASEFILCEDGEHVKPMQCKAGHVFDPVRKECSSDIAESVRSYCRRNPDAVFPDALHCARYYNCSHNSTHHRLNPYQDECPYLLLFDPAKRECVMYNNPTMSCGSRFEPINPCDYKIGHCIGRTYCLLCDAKCKGNQDGLHPYPSYPDTRFHLVCERGRTLNISQCAGGHIFSRKHRQCMPDGKNKQTTTSASPDPSTPKTTESAVSFPVSSMAAEVCTCADEMIAITNHLSNISYYTTYVLQDRNPYDCNEPPPIRNGETIVFYETDAAVATYNCDDGYSVCDGQLKRSCVRENVWNNALLGDCVQDTWTDTNYVILSCHPRTDSVLLFRGRSFEDLYAVSLINFDNGQTYLHVKIRSTTRTVEAGTTLKTLTPVTSSIPLTGETTWTIEFKATAFEVSVNGRHVTTVPHKTNLSNINTLIINSAFSTNLVKYYPRGITASDAPKKDYSTDVLFTRWSPFSCPDPPSAEGASVQLSYTKLGAIATYKCHGAGIMCTGKNIIHCSNETGWDAAAGRCFKTIINAKIGESLSSFPVCPLNLGSGLELWVTPKAKRATLTVAQSETFVVLRIELDLEKVDKPVGLYHYHSETMSAVVYPTVMPFVKDKESHVVFTALTDFLLIEVDGIVLCEYPYDQIKIGKPLSLRSTPGFSIRKAKLYPDRIFEVNREPVTNNLALRANVTSSSSYSNSEYFGVDGNSNMAWPTGSCWKADIGDTNQWYQIDLGKQYFIKKISIDHKNIPILGSFISAFKNNGFVEGPLSALSGEWSPFECASPPTRTNAFVKVSYSLERALATYHCFNGFSMCNGPTTSSCTKTNGWTGSIGTCLPRTFQNVDLNIAHFCPLRLGEVVELYLTPKDAGPLLELGTDVKTMLQLEWTDSASENVIIHVSTDLTTGDPKSAYVHTIPFGRHEEVRIVITIVSHAFHININGKTFYIKVKDPHMIDTVRTNNGTMDKLTIFAAGDSITYVSLPDNLALARPTKFSSESYDSVISGRAVDGDLSLSLNSNSCWLCSVGDMDIWWTVDLDSLYFVSHVKVTTRSDCESDCNRRTHHFKIEMFHKMPEPQEAVDLCLQYDGILPLASTTTLKCTENIYGRLLRISAPDRRNENDLSTLCEIQVFGGLVLKTGKGPRNLAMFRPAQASSMLEIAERVVDGYKNPRYLRHSCWSAETSDPKPWWQVELDSHYYISHVEITSTETVRCAPSCKYSLRDFVIEVTPIHPDLSPQRELCLHYGSVFPYGTTLKLRCLRRLPGRFLRITRTVQSDDAKFTLCEVEVYGDEVFVPETTKLNLALDRPVSSSSRRSPPQWAVDGNRFMGWAENSCWSAEDGETTSWLLVELDDYYMVSEVEITSRSDCGVECNKRLRNFIIEVFYKSPKPEDRGNICFEYISVFPHSTTKLFRCKDQILGKFVRLISPHRQPVNDSLTLCEMKVFGARLNRHGWTPFKCPQPPVLPNGRVKMYYTPDYAVAMYTCNTNYSMCTGSHHLFCNGEAGWEGTLGGCVQTTREIHHGHVDSPEEFTICHPGLGNGIEMWLTPKAPWNTLELLFGENALQLSISPGSTVEPVTLKIMRDGILSGVSKPNMNLFTLHQESHVGFIFTTNAILIRVDGKRLISYPHLYTTAPSRVTYIRSVAGFRVRKVRPTNRYVDGTTEDIHHWTVFDCPDPPLHHRASVQLSYSPGKAIATYTCNRDYSMCTGSNTLQCTGDDGWEGTLGTCQQTTLKHVLGQGKDLDEFSICNLQLGEGIELWIIPKALGCSVSLMIEPEGDTALQLVITPGQTDGQVRLRSKIGTETNEIPLEKDVFSLEREAHVAFVFLSFGILVLVDGIVITLYPHYIATPKISFVQSTKDMQIRRARPIPRFMDKVARVPQDENLALRKVISISSQSSNADPSHLVDGDRSQLAGQDRCWYPRVGDKDQWIMIHLSGYFFIRRLILHNRGSSPCPGCGDRTHDFVINVLATHADEEFATCAVYTGTMPVAAIEKIHCKENVWGRYVRIQATDVRDDSDLMTFCEIEIYGDTVSDKRVK